MVMITQSCLGELTGGIIDLSEVADVLYTAEEDDDS